jgi:hypothetical protein
VADHRSFIPGRDQDRDRLFRDLQELLFGQGSVFAEDEEAAVQTADAVVDIDE